MQCASQANRHTAVRLISISSRSRVTGTAYSRDLPEALPREIASARIAHQHFRSALAPGLDEGKRPLGERPLIEHIAHQYDPNGPGSAASRSAAVVSSATPLAPALSSIAASANGSISAASTEAAPALHAAIAREARARTQVQHALPSHDRCGCPGDSAPAPARRPRRKPSRAAARSSGQAPPRSSARWAANPRQDAGGFPVPMEQAAAWCWPG